MIFDRKQRKRAYSECTKIKQITKQIHEPIVSTRPQSDSDLSFIDREKTFASQNQHQVEPSELLAKISVALSEYRSGYPSNLGYCGFSESEILADEVHYSNLSIATSGGRYIPPEVHPRNRRALSEVCIPIEKSIKVMSNFAIYATCSKLNF